MEKRRVEDSKTENSYNLRPTHINGYGRLFGGILMQWIDEMAGLVSRRHCHAEVTTAAIDNLVFKSAAYINDVLVLSGQVTYVGRTSMEVRVLTYAEDQKTGMRRMINRAYVVMVAIDQDGNALEVPGLELEHEEQIMEWEGGRRRYELRKERRIEGY